MTFEPVRLVTTFFGFFTLISYTINTYALNQDYVKAVKADVEEFSSHEFIPPDNSEWLGSEENQSAQLVDLQGFTEFIRTQSPGSYIFYKKLSDDYQKKLHQDYLSTGDFERIKQDIFKYTQEMKQQSRTSRISR
jgi:hypothetical protein